MRSQRKKLIINIPAEKNQLPSPDISVKGNMQSNPKGVIGVSVGT